MRHLVRCAAAVSLWHSTFAATCFPPSDLTSLVQVKHMVARRSDRVDTQQIDAAAEGRRRRKGDVTDHPQEAFESNMAKAKNLYEKSGSGALAFEDNVTAQWAARDAAIRQAVSDQHAADQALAEDAAKVQAVAMKKFNVGKAAMEEVAKAKENWLASKIKEAQTEQAAIQGQLFGTAEGRDNVAGQLLDSRKEMENYLMTKAQQQEEAFEAKRTAQQKEYLNRMVQEQAAAEKAYKQRSKEMAKAVEARASANTGVASEILAGAESLNDKLIKKAAHFEAEWYKKNTPGH